ncbi:hypothetical protein HHK36_030276 [Tetracentron sinense]|uniref:Uncharacterized protein n=1 Tax=Tetracentron sinense TaxID=13715 RepID=A0A835D0D7_TETSI|nr:hypothetical protein HHK36_030276 [Tetracentron sinense]
MWRSALVNYGKDYGKLVVIVDVIDQNRNCIDYASFTFYLVLRIGSESDHNDALEPVLVSRFAYQFTPKVWDGKLPSQEDSVKQEDGFSIHASKLSPGRSENKEFNESEDVEEVEGGRGHLPFE